MAITAAFETGDIIDPSTGKPAVSVIDEKQLATIAKQLGVPYVHRTTDDGGLGIIGSIQLKELAPLRATESAEIVGGRSELGWIALLLVALLAAWELGALVAAASRARRPARSVASTAGGQISPRAGMRLAALRPSRIRGRGQDRGVSSDLAPPLDPTAPREVEPLGTGGRP